MTNTFIGAASGKNFPLSPAASDLGLGDQLTQSIADDDEERKKKLLAMANQQEGMGAGTIGMSPAVAALMGGKLGAV